MPNSRSAKKRLRQEVKKTASNRDVRSGVRNQVKKIRSLISAGDAEGCQTAFRTACKKLDQAAAKGIMHANTAARTKSRLSKAIKGMSAA